MDPRIKALIEWIARDAEPDTAPANWGRGVFLCNAEYLLDQIHELWGIPKEKIGAIFNPIREAQECR